MVSLNEKKSKIQYVVQNKTEWVDDENKFGRRMLEKMGWKSGCGLGKNEDGRKEHIDLKYKSNLKGVGFINGIYDSTWIEHSRSFDSLLKQLKQSHPSSDLSSSSSCINDFNQTVQQTKTRFTYKKQSSGKDLSSRSNNELDCIFGWNKDNQINPDQTKQDSDEEKKSETISDNLYKTSKQSIHDYFKEKSKKKGLIQSGECQSSNDHQINSVDKSSSYQQIPLNKSVKQLIDKQVELTSDTISINKRKHNRESTNDIDQSEKINKKIKSNILNVENPYIGSNLSEFEGYQGWNIDSTLENIIKKKDKQKKRHK
ncbi:unnamed protein product [Rotaria sordida]|uniref:G-patch domain-containing protein n=1 Tax=Rotaria sordida TaxID=392033 RepID=A0A815JPA9_9BILA|nr:unnamed protein product [Rotaria sordida]CAF3957153.1 unnamed protein product [Rotaria sordida]